MEQNKDKKNDYVKVALYAYPTLKTLIKEYKEHIYERAVHSYGGKMDAEEAVTYIAQQILNMQALECLKEILERVFSKLSAIEWTMLALRYFGLRRKSVKAELIKEKKQFSSERGYFRAQEKLLKKTAALLQAAGLDEKYFQSRFCDIDELKPIYRYVEKGKDAKMLKREKEFALKENTSV